MQDLTIALAQVNQLWENKTANFDHFETLLSRLGTVDLILLPEMFHTGFSMNAPELAETTDNSPALDWIRKIARSFDAAVYTSFIARDGDRYYNRGVFAEPSGEIHIYDKRKVFGLAGEHEVYTPGTAETIVSFRGWNIQLQICYDLRFPENARNGLDATGKPFYDLLLYVANWPERRSAHWNTLLPARAIENQAYVAGLNRVGEDASGHTYTGNSVVYSPLGEALLSCEPGLECVKTIKIVQEDLVAIRRALPFLKDR